MTIKLRVPPEITSFVIRVLMASMFIESFIDKIMHWDKYIAEVAAQGMPLPALSLAGAAVVEIGGSFSLLSGKFLREGSVILAGYVFVIGFVYFDFWNLNDAASIVARKEFLKGLAVVAGLLLLATTQISSPHSPVTRKE